MRSIILLLGLIVALCVCWYLANQFFEVATEKGFTDRKYFWICLLFDAASFSDEIKRRDATPKAEASVIHNAELIRQAIAAKKKISFRYFHRLMVRETNYKKYFNYEDKYTEFDDSDALNIVSPKSLEWNNGSYSMTVYTKDPFFFTYQLERMENIKILNQDCEYLAPEPIEDEEVLRLKETLDKLKKGTASIPFADRMVLKRDGYDFEPEKEYAVTILIPEALIEEVRQFWGNEIQIIPYDSYHVMFTVHTHLATPLFTWLIQQGSSAKVLAPKEAIGELFRFIKKTEDLYGYGTDDFLKDIPTTYDEMRSQKHSL